MLSQPWIDCGRANKQAGWVEGKQAGWMGRILVVVEVKGYWSCAGGPVGWMVAAGLDAEGPVVGGVEVSPASSPTL